MEMTMQDIIIEASRQRPALPRAIGYAGAYPLRDVTGVPDPIAPIYRIAEGTLRGIEDQTLMDIVPGYRLIHQTELPSEIFAFRKAYPSLRTHYPFLADYSSCYYTIDSMDGVVYRVRLESDATPISDSLKHFLDTLLVFYRQTIYFCDAEGYLDYNTELEGKIGAVLNPRYEYWTA
jgi:hypothetical protein